MHHKVLYDLKGSKQKGTFPLAQKISPVIELKDVKKIMNYA